MTHQRLDNKGLFFLILMSRRRAILLILSLVTVGTLLLVAFFGGMWSTTNDGHLGTFTRDIIALLTGAKTQWLAFACACFYFVLLEFLHYLRKDKRFFRLENPDLWLVALVAVSVLSYAESYSVSAAESDALLLLGGVALGKLVRCLVSNEHLAKDGQVLFGIIAILFLFLILCSQWHSVSIYHYREQSRWSGPWVNPNTFGLLMALGFVIGIGLIMLIQVSDVAFSVDGRFIIRASIITLSVALLLIAIALIKSYSRGAWLATLVGTVYLGAEYALFNTDQSSVWNWMRRHRVSISLIFFALFVLAFWHFRSVEYRPIRRLFSVSNLNDFSWRNRVKAWEGSLQMMADSPWRGCGWNQSEPVYDNYYRYPTTVESMAIELNDFFKLGTTLGFPAMLFFLAYVWLSCWRRFPVNAKDGRPGSGLPRLEVICRAGVLVLLVGFFFDGGLFKVPTSLPFWILLELGREESYGDSPEDSKGRLLRSSLESPQITRKTLLLCMGRRYVISKVSERSKTVALFAPIVLLSLFLTGLLWARARDPFRRVSWIVHTGDGQELAAAAVLPKRGMNFPVVVFANGFGSNLLTTGDKLRRIAEVGCAAISFEYNQTNAIAFNSQMESFMTSLGGKSWANTNRMAWIGSSLGASRQLSLLLQWPNLKLKALVRLGSGWVDELGPGPSTLSNFQSSASLFGLPVLLVHGGSDEVVPASTARFLAAALEQAAASVTLTILPGQPHNLGDDRNVVLRRAAEFCGKRLGCSAIVPVNMIPSFWYYWIPAWILVGMASGGFLYFRVRKPNPCKLESWTSPANCRKFLFPTVLPRLASGLLITLAVADTAVHMLLPQLAVSPRTLSLAKAFIVPPRLRADFDWLNQDSRLQGKRLGDVIEHVFLADLQRNHFRGNHNEQIFRQYVLSPWVQSRDGDIHWRRTLWEAAYPRIRNTSDQTSAARIMIRFIQERLSFNMVSDGDALQGRDVTNSPITEEWEKGEANSEAISVALFRAIGCAARMDSNEELEIMLDGQWKKRKDI